MTRPRGRTLLVPEIGANHGGDVATAHSMIDALAAAGAECVKFQIYTAEELVADGDRMVTWGRGDAAVNEPLGAMFDRLSLPWGAFDELFAHARDLGMDPFATPFSREGLTKLLSLGPSRIKVASSDVGHLPFLHEVGSTGLPVMLSLGKSTLAEADAAVSALDASGCADLTLLHCVAAYPAPIVDANLNVLVTLRTAFPHCRVGYSDHTQGSVAAIVAVALGAEVIERHVTLDPARPGPDEWFSLPISEFAELNRLLDEAGSSLGSSRKVIAPSELAGRSNGTRSLVAASDLSAGTVLRPGDLKVVRPGTGLPPGLLNDIVGLTVQVDVPRNTPLTWQMFKG